MIRCLRFSACISLVAFTTNSANAGSIFLGIGGIRSTNISTVVDGLSADGTTLVGSSLNNNGKFEAFRWTEAGGMEGLGLLDTSLSSGRSRGRGVSADGSVVAGESPSRSPVISLKSVRWDSAGSIQRVGAFPGVNPSGFARDVDDAGIYVVGRGGSLNSQPDNGSEAYRWSVAGGTEGLGDLPGDRFFSEARGISGDGEVVVGYSQSSNGNEAFRWTSSGGMVGLGDLAGGAFNSFAQDASKDGSVIVGFGSSNNGSEAFRWTSAGFTALGDLSGGTFSSSALAINADGTIIGGVGTSALGNEGFIWDATSGMRRVQDYLADFGLDTNGWTLTSVTGISDDGLTIAGTGSNPDGRTEGWIARISSVPEPSAVLILVMLNGISWCNRRRRSRRLRDLTPGCL